jgi:hypothetical protein
MNDERVLTLEDVREAALAALAEAGDHVYKPPYPKLGGVCVYTAPGGAPSCLIGHVWSRVDEELFSEALERERTSYWRSSFTAATAMRWYPERYTPAAKQWLVDVQMYQDTLIPWSEAIRRADENYLSEEFGDLEGTEYDDQVRASLERMTP